MENQVWHTLVVRLWRDGDGLKVRFLASRTDRRQTALSVATTPESATEQFARWLESTDRHDNGRADGAEALGATGP